MKNIFALIIVLIVLILTVIIANCIVNQDPYKRNMRQTLKPPSADHIFGTDKIGRDVFSRVMIGYSNTVIASIIALIISILLGLIFGILSGLYSGLIVDKIINFAINIILSLPFIVTITSLMILWKSEANLYHAFTILGCILWVFTTRIIRPEIIRIKQSLCTTSLKSFGFSNFYILSRYTIPTSIKPVIYFSLFYLPEIIGLEAGLSFLGFGVSPPEPGLGKMIYDGINSLTSSWWLSIYPAIVLVIPVILIRIILTIFGKGKTIIYD